MSYFKDVFHEAIDITPEWLLALILAFSIYAFMARHDTFYTYIIAFAIAIWRIIRNKPIFPGGKPIMQQFWWKGRNGGISTRKISFHRAKDCQDLIRSASPIKEIRREIAELRGFRPCGRCCK